MWENYLLFWEINKKQHQQKQKQNQNQSTKQTSKNYDSFWSVSNGVLRNFRIFTDVMISPKSIPIDRGKWDQGNIQGYLYEIPETEM